MENQKSESNLPGRQFRFDRNFVNSFCVTSARTEADRKLCWYIMLHVASTYQNDIFNSGVFDMDKFCEEWGFFRQDLARYHENPYQKAEMMDYPEEYLMLQEGHTKQSRNAEFSSDSYLWRSVIENALYILLRTSVSFPDGKGGVFKDPNIIEVSKSATGEQVFTELYCVTNNKGKVLYYYSLNERFIKNFNSFFVLLNVESLKALRRKGLEELYIFLLDVRNSVYGEGRTKTSFSPGFEKLCDLAKVRKYKENGDEYEFRYRKRNLNDALETVIEKAKDLNFTVEWQAGHGTVKDTPLFDFGQVGFEFFKERENIVFWRIFGEELTRKYAEHYVYVKKASFQNLREQMVLDWLKDKNDNWSLKVSAFEVVYTEVFKKPKGSNEISDMFIKFLSFVDKGYRIQDIYPNMIPGKNMMY